MDRLDVVKFLLLNNARGHLLAGDMERGQATGHLDNVPVQRCLQEPEVFLRDRQDGCFRLLGQGHRPQGRLNRIAQDLPQDSLVHVGRVGQGHAGSRALLPGSDEREAIPDQVEELLEHGWFDRRGPECKQLDGLWRSKKKQNGGQLNVYGGRKIIFTCSPYPGPSNT